jgi:hypothetical protein
MTRYIVNYQQDTKIRTSVAQGPSLDDTPPLELLHILQQLPPVLTSLPSSNTFFKSFAGAQKVSKLVK